MKFTEFRKQIDKIVELQSEIEKIKKEEYEKLSRREQINYNISAALNKIDNAQDIEEKFFSKDVYETIHSKLNAIKTIKTNLTDALGDWDNLFWIDIKEFNDLLNENVHNINNNGSFVVSLEKQNEYNFITGETKSKGLLKITYKGEEETAYTIKIDAVDYDFPEIKNLIMKTVRRNQMKTNYIKISPEILCDASWQEFEQDMLPIDIRDIYWKAVKISIEKLKQKKVELLMSTVSKNIAKIDKINEQIDRLNENSQSCISKKNEINENFKLETAE